MSGSVTGIENLQETDRLLANNVSQYGAERTQGIGPGKRGSFPVAYGEMLAHPFVFEILLLLLW